MLSIVILSSCGLKVGEDASTNDKLSVPTGQCISEAMPTVKRFLQAQASQPEIGTAWDCIIGAMGMFRKYVRGRGNDLYEVQELATFFEDNYLDSDLKISADLQKEFMKFKQLFVGGSISHLTLKELDKTIDVFSSFKELSIKINPYMDVVMQKWGAGEASNQMKHFEQANIEIQNLAKGVSAIILNNHQAYVLDDFYRFMNLFQEFYKEQWESTANIKKFLPFFKKFKKAVAGGDENEISSTEWKSFILLGARGYMLYLRYYYFIKPDMDNGVSIKLAYLSQSIEDGFSLFKDLVSEKNSGEVSKGEMSEALFALSGSWDSFKVSDELVNQIMNIKKLLFGGNVYAWSINDFEAAKIKINRLRLIIEKFMPYYTVYGQEWQNSNMSENEKDSFFQESEHALESAAKELGAFFESNYDLKNLTSLFGEIEKLYPEVFENGSSIAASLKKYMPLVIQTKNIIFKNNDDFIRLENWSNFLSTTSRIYLDYLYYYYFLKGNSINDKMTLARTSVFSEKSLTLLQDVFLLRGGQIPNLELMPLLLKLQDLDFISAEVQQSSLEKLLLFVSHYVLSDYKSRIVGFKNDMKYKESLDLKSIEIMKEESRLFFESEKYLVNVFLEKPDWTSEELLKKFQGEVKSLSQDSQFLKTSLKELAMILDNNSVTMTFDKMDRVIISAPQKTTYDINSLFFMNMGRAVSRLLLRSFGTDIHRIETYGGASLQETKDVYAFVKPFFIEAKIISSKASDFAESRFREANIFTPHANGDSLLSLPEGADIVRMLYSGVQINNFIEAEVISSCVPAHKITDIYTPIALSCLDNYYLNRRRGADQHLDSMLGYLNFKSKLSESVWSPYFLNIAKASGYVASSNHEILLSEAAQVSHVIQYVEMLFSRFDKDNNGQITYSEAQVAYPSAFKELLKELAKDDMKGGFLAEKDLEGLFYYILYYGKPPETMSEKLYFRLVWLYFKKSKWQELSADRVKIAQIIGYVADQFKLEKKKSFFQKQKDLNQLLKNIDFTKIDLDPQLRKNMIEYFDLMKYENPH